MTSSDDDDDDDDDDDFDARASDTVSPLPQVQIQTQMVLHPKELKHGATLGTVSELNPSTLSVPTMNLPGSMTATASGVSFNNDVMNDNGESGFLGQPMTTQGSRRPSNISMASMVQASRKASVVVGKLKDAAWKPRKTLQLEQQGLVLTPESAGPSGSSGSGGAPISSMYHRRTIVTEKDDKKLLKDRNVAAKTYKKEKDSKRETEKSEGNEDTISEVSSEWDGDSDDDSDDDDEPPMCAWTKNIPIVSSFGRYAQVVTVTMTLIAAWSGYAVPLFLAFHGTYEDIFFLSWDSIFIMTQVLDVIYFVCCMSQFVIAYIDLEYKEEVFVFGMIFMQRIRTPMLWVDFASCAPVPITDAVSACLKMTRCYRLLTVSITFQHLQFRAAIQIGRMVMSVMYGSHILACIWYWVIESQGHFHQYLARYTALGSLPSPYLVVWRDAVYMMFNRPVQAHNDIELIINIIMAPIGAMVIATIFGNINWLFQRIHARSMKHFEELSTVEQALRELHGVPWHLSQRIIDYYRYLQIHHDNHHDALLKGLSPTLLLELKLYLYAELLAHAPFFAFGVPPQIIKAMVMVLNLGIFSSGDYVIHRNESADAMYFIIRGCTEVLLELDSEPVVSFVKGQYFGEMALYRSVDCNAKRTAWVRAVTFCHLARLTRDSFEDILHQFPDEGEMLLQKIGDEVADSGRFQTIEEGSDEEDSDDDDDDEEVEESELPGEAQPSTASNSGSLRPKAEPDKEAVAAKGKGVRFGSILSTASRQSIIASAADHRPQRISFASNRRVSGSQGFVNRLSVASNQHRRVSAARTSFSSPSMETLQETEGRRVSKRLSTGADQRALGNALAELDEIPEEDYEELNDRELLEKSCRMSTETKHLQSFLVSRIAQLEIDMRDLKKLVRNNSGASKGYGGRPVRASILGTGVQRLNAEFEVSKGTQERTKRGSHQDNDVRKVRISETTGDDEAQKHSELQGDAFSPQSTPKRETQKKSIRTDNHGPLSMMKTLSSQKAAEKRSSAVATENLIESLFDRGKAESNSKGLGSAGLARWKAVKRGMKQGSIQN